MENGWQGGPPETNSTRSCHCVRSTWRMSLSKRRRSEPIARCQFSRKVLQESVSRSTTATGLNPASCNPRARPPLPANSSIVSIQVAFSLFRDGKQAPLGAFGGRGRGRLESAPTDEARANRVGEAVNERSGRASDRK